jgi:glycosyltransferase involved in cell wall biosynthesis
MRLAPVSDPIAMPERLTVLIPCRNERKNIRACIASVRGLADEVLVADSLSTDDTLDIVRSIGGCRVIEREFGGYADFKNWAIPQAAHPWVLIVDADERVTPELAGEIRGILANPPRELDGYWIGRENYFLGHRIRHCGWNSDAVFRLIRRDVCRYRQVRVHEEIDVDARRAGHTKANLAHYTYWTFDQFFAKHVKYTKLGAEDAWDRGKRTGFYNLALRPTLRFLQLYFLRLGFLDGLAGLQVCMLTAFFNTFVKQARLWEMEHALPQPDDDPTLGDANPTATSAERRVAA